MGKLSREELGEELCNYCPLEENQKGVHCYGDEPVMCFDSGCCEKAYTSYLEDFEEENEEMNNLEKAKLAAELSAKIKQHTKNIVDLEDRQEQFKKGEKATIVFYCHWNSGISIEANEVLIECMIVQEKAGLAKAEKELDELLNGDVKKLKACLEGIDNGQQDSRE